VTTDEGKESFPSPFGRYTLTERLALGGMAEVFKAKITSTHGFEKLLVIKRILPQLAADRTFVSMFIDEAKLTAQLIHPKIVQVIDFGEVKGQYFIALEFIDGFDALALLRGSASKSVRLPGPICLFIAMEVLDALDYAHNARDGEGRPMRLVHRDISPSNLFISRRGDVKLGDFGIAHAQERESKTQAGTLKGKYGYMSPEQVLGGALDGRSDLFAVGIVLAEMLMGRRLFSAPNDLDVLLMVRDGRLDRLDKYARDLPAGLDHIVRKALAKRVEDRFQTAAEFRDAIADLLFQSGMRVSPSDIGRIAADFLDPSPDAAARATAQCKRWEMRSTGSHPGYPLADRPATGPIAISITGPSSLLGAGMASSSSSAPTRPPTGTNSAIALVEADLEGAEAEEPIDIELEDHPAPAAAARKPASSGSGARRLPADPSATARLDQMLAQPLSVVDLDKYEAPGAHPAHPGHPGHPASGTTPAPVSAQPTAIADLSAMSALRIFCDLAVGQETGLLRIEAAPHTRDLHFSRGVPTQLASTAPGEAISDVRGLIIALFALGRGRASFFRGVQADVRGRWDQTPALDPFEIMGAGVVALPLEVLRQRFYPWLSHCPAANAPPRVDPASFRLGPTPHELWAMLDGARTIKDWLAGLPAADEQMTFLRTLYLLTETGLARIV
jgi:serine/threonine protein kinase